MDITKENIAKIINETCEIDISSYTDDLILCGVDSLCFIQAIVVLEDEFNCEIPDEYLDIGKINTIEKIHTLIKGLLENE